jgi:methyl-accepting chemotaxis protein
MEEMKLTHKKLIFTNLIGLLFLVFITTFSFSGFSVAAEQQELTGFDLQVKDMAFNCRDEVVKELDKLLATNKLNLAKLFDTFYTPIPNTNPQKFNTQYDKLTDEVLRIIFDKYLDADKRLQFVVAVDINGYVPTHNSRYSKPLTDNVDYNTANNRTKQLYNDRTGLAAAVNTNPYLLQKYSRDNGEEMFDLSVPIFISGKHWGAIRIGYKPK